MVQNRWSNEESGHRDDARRGRDPFRERDGRRDAFRYSERDRGAPAYGDDRRGRDYRSEATGNDQDEPFGHADDRYHPYYDRSGRPAGIYGPGSYGTGRGSSYYDRDAWGRGDFGLGWRGQEDDDYRRADRGRGFDRFGYGRNDERGFWDRASDEVASWFGDRDAERRREEDEFRGRGPKGYARSEDRIREDVNDRLTDDSFVDASEIEVAVAGGEVTLSGSVRTREQRRRAEDCAESVSGVTYVQNNLRVRTGETAGTPTPSVGQTAFGREASATTSEAARIGSGARIKGR